MSGTDEKNIIAKFQDPIGKANKALGKMEEKAKAFNDLTNPFSDASKKIGQIPFYSTGARAFIKVGGRPVGVCTDIRWQVSYQANPIHTIDTPHAWDVDIGQANVTASLNQILDPTQGPEATGLFATMQSAVHQPFVEMQILDSVGTSLFFARGMFTGVSGSITRGAVSNISAQFVGVAYQHFVRQGFQPYESVSSTASNLVNGLKNLASNVTGGLF